MSVYNIPELSLQFDLEYQDLYTAKGLRIIDEEFQKHLQDCDAELFKAYITARNVSNLASDIIIKVAPYVEDFIGKLFGIENELLANQKLHNDAAILRNCARTFVQRRVANKLTLDKINGLSSKDMLESLEHYMNAPFDDITFATKVMEWLQDPEAYEDQIDAAVKYTVWVLSTKEGQKKHEKSPLFYIHKKMDFSALVSGLEDNHHTLKLDSDSTEDRQGFKLTDHGLSLDKSVAEANYCIFCHERGKDSCAKGLYQKKSDTNLEVNPLKQELSGCPLDEKISEMNYLKAQGEPLAALVAATIENPLIAATGHRICNDCSAACIYQKQEPVDIPGIETETLKNILHLPWGFEIYSLLTKWNPLRFDGIHPKDNTNNNIMVVGMGPAGFTLAHYLLQEGHNVVAVDGLKIEPLQQVIDKPIYDINSIWLDLDERIVSGFGGVAEYGITSRWDKNFLTIIRLILERHHNFRLFGGFRFGSNITVDQAFNELGFEHVALCTGAGKPNLLDIKNSLARGVRQASDFLMALQLTGAAKQASIANLEVRLPAVVIGAGLTAIDTATEILAYYPVQVEKFLSRHETLVNELGQAAVEASWNTEEKHLAETWLEHGQTLREEKQKSNPDILQHLKSWGGVKVIYRKELQESPGYRLNHKEVFSAFKEGIEFVYDTTPIEFKLDEYAHVESVVAQQDTATIRAMIEIPAQSIFIATGTKPNKALEKEYPGIFSDSKCNISIFGDLDPKYSGSVVGAMASAKDGYKQISASLKPKQESSNDFFAKIEKLFSATIHEVKRLNESTIEVIVKSHFAARNFAPGQFYRLQNYETFAHKINGTTLAMESLALTGAWVDKGNDLVSLIILEMGGSSDICQLLEPGEPIVLMGPTGSPTSIPQNEKICLIGGGLGNAVLFSIGAALKSSGNEVTYIAGYRNSNDIFYQDKIESAADKIIWLSESDPLITSNREQDISLQGNIITGLEQLEKSTIDRFITIGSDGMMQAVQKYLLQSPDLKPGAKLIASINSPMQCMMKEICAQCLQRHVDPTTGKETYVYSCANQDQEMALVDFKHLHQRLQQNSLQEKITGLWLEKCLREL